jgi:hypothetical protein
VWNSLTVGQCGEGRDYEKRRVTSAKFRSTKPIQSKGFIGSLQVLCRLAAREERQECLLRIVRPHSLREHF